MEVAIRALSLKKSSAAVIATRVGSRCTRAGGSLSFQLKPGTVGAHFFNQQLRVGAQERTATRAGEEPTQSAPMNRQISVELALKLSQYFALPLEMIFSLEPFPAITAELRRLNSER